MVSKEPITRYDGTVRYFETIKSPVKDSLGNVVLSIGISRDLTDRESVINRLKVTEERLALAVKGSDLGLWDWDIPSGQVIFNDRWAEMLGYKKEELPHDISTWEKLVHPDDKLIVLPILEAHLKGENPIYETEHRMLHKSGEWIWILDRGKVVKRDENNNPLRAVGTHHDITTKKLIEIEQNRAKEIAEKNLKIREQFLANISHEIRTPMNGIIGMAELALKTQLTEEARDCINTIRESSNHLLVIINDLLDFSKIEANKLNFNFDEINLENFLKKTFDFLSTKFNEKDLENSFIIDTDVPQNIVIDEVRLRQVLLNLLGNSVKFSKAHGMVLLKVAKVQEPSETLRLHFSISDTGIGIHAHSIEEIFSPFAQADGSITRRYGGTGLGLSIAKRLIELMGGSIWVNSIPDRGTTFHFTISTNNINEKKLNKAIPLPIPPAKLVKSLQILLVEDNLINQKVAAKMLVNAGHQVDIACNGKECLEKLFAPNAKQYDLILMDCQMPIMSGYEATMAIREHEKVSGAHTPIIAFTAHAMKEDQEKCLNAGMDDYVTKPVTIEGLTAVINRVILK